MVLILVDNYLVLSHHRFYRLGSLLPPLTFLHRHIKYVSERTRYNMLSTGKNTNLTRVETINLVFRNRQNLTLGIRIGRTKMVIR